MDDKLTSFVDHAKTKGIDLAIIRQLLISSGWRDADVAAAFWPRELNLPVPTPSRRGEPRSQARRRPASPWPRRAREAFLHLLTFGALFTWATTLFLLTFSFIDLTFPDPAWRLSRAMLDEIHSVMRWQIATLIVAFPLFLGLWRYLLREIRHDPEKRSGSSARSPRRSTNSRVLRALSGSTSPNRKPADATATPSRAGRCANCAHHSRSSAAQTSRCSGTTRPESTASASMRSIPPDRRKSGAQQ